MGAGVGVWAAAGLEAAGGATAGPLVAALETAPPGAPLPEPFPSALVAAGRLAAAGPRPVAASPGW